MTYVRVTRDQRGYETTFLLHSARPGAPPRVLYWYRTPPGVRVGRAALDEDAIRTIEEEHPEIEFDWAELLDEARNVPTEIERPPERRRRPAPTRAPTAAAVATPAGAVEDESGEGGEQEEASTASSPEPSREVPVEVSVAANPLLEQLVGREIAKRLRARYAEIAERIAASAVDDAHKTAWNARAEALNPDKWVTPDAMLHGIEHADASFDELRRQVLDTN